MNVAVVLAAMWIAGMAASAWIQASPVRPMVLSGKINPNTADEALLQTLPNIGPARARAVVEYRRGNHGEERIFRRIEDLHNVKGIGPKISEGLRSWITFETDDQFVNGIPIDVH